MAVERARMPLSLAVYGDAARVTPELESRFFKKLRLPNGTYKTTHRRRLDDVNELVLGLLPTGRRIDIMDVAVSSGFSTLEWSDYLTKHDVEHRIVAGDLMTEAQLTSFGRRLAIMFDDSGENPLLVEFGQVSLPIRSDRWLAKAVRPVLFPLLRRLDGIGRRATAGESADRGKRTRWSHRRVPLVSPELGQRPDVEVIQDDITQTGHFPMAFDVIRAANLVQRVYFDEPTLETMITNLRDRLRDGGLLILCRTSDDGVNRATVFRRQGRSFVCERSINGGSEVRDLVLAL